MDEITDDEVLSGMQERTTDQHFLRRSFAHVGSRIGIPADMPRGGYAHVIPVAQAFPVIAAIANRTMHTEMHGLAKDISEWCGEPKLFARYLGRIKAVGLQRAYTLFSEMKQSRNPIKNRAALFMAITRKKK